MVLQADVPVRQCVGLRRFPRPATVTHVFRRFTPTAIPAMVEPRWTWGLDRLPQPAGDPLDASVFERSGTQEGALKGDTPTTRDRHSPTLWREVPPSLAMSLFIRPFAATRTMLGRSTNRAGVLRPREQRCNALRSLSVSTISHAVRISLPSAHILTDANLHVTLIMQHYTNV